MIYLYFLYKQFRKTRICIGWKGHREYLKGIKESLKATYGSIRFVAFRSERSEKKHRTGSWRTCSHAHCVASQCFHDFHLSLQQFDADDASNGSKNVLKDLKGERCHSLRHQRVHWFGGPIQKVGQPFWSEKQPLYAFMTSTVWQDVWKRLEFARWLVSR